VERWNNTLRQRLGAFVRKTRSFSQCDYRHDARLKHFLHRYNATRV
jgi:insertion element IS1 protein InsB